MEIGAPPPGKRGGPSSWRSPAGDGPTRAQRWAWLLLCAALVGLGVYTLANYLRGLAWALVFSVALWPAYARIRRRTPSTLSREALPALFTLLVGFAILIPVATIAVEAAREARELIEYGRNVEHSGVPVPDFVTRLPYVGVWAADQWRARLSHAGWAKELVQQINTSSARQLAASLGADALHRFALFAVCLLTLFFLFRHGESLTAQCRTASQKLFGAWGERIAVQMVASVHGTVNGLVLVAIGEGILLGFVYVFVKLPHPILFGAATAVAAMIPFAAALVIGLAAVVLLGSSGVGPAVLVIASGVVVTFVADHLVRPKLIGGATKLPFLWVLLGILGGVETFQLIGLFLGPAIMAALMLLWRELAGPSPDDGESGRLST